MFIQMVTLFTLVKKRLLKTHIFLYKYNCSSAAHEIHNI